LNKSFAFCQCKNTVSAATSQIAFLFNGIMISYEIMMPFSFGVKPITSLLLRLDTKLLILAKN